MELEQAFELTAPPELAWEAFRDVALLVSCLPGASLDGPADADPLRIRLEVKLGPIAARFAGEGRVAYADDRTGSLGGSGTDRATGSRVKGEARFALEPCAAGTRVRVNVEYALGGALAQFGRTGIVKELALRLTRQFAANLQARLTAAMNGAGPEADSAEAKALDAGALVGGALWQRARQWVGRK